MQVFETKFEMREYIKGLLAYAEFDTEDDEVLGVADEITDQLINGANGDATKVTYEEAQDLFDDRLEYLQMNDEEESEAHYSDDLKANFRSWERDCDNREDAESLFEILKSRHPDEKEAHLYKAALDWVGYDPEERF